MAFSQSISSQALCRVVFSVPACYRDLCRLGQTRVSFGGEAGTEFRPYRLTSEAAPMGHSALSLIHI